MADVEKSRGPSDADIVAPGEEEGAHLEHHSGESTITVEESHLKREKWGSKMQFLMSCIASAVGLGNVWRFPAICAKNGGFAFLFPYTIVLFVIARPLFVLELVLGQFSSKGSVRCWDVCPALTGIGLTGMVSSVLLSTFYIMLLAWALIYSVIAFTSFWYFTEPQSLVPIWGLQTGPYFGGEVIRHIPFNMFSYGGHEAQYLKPICHLVLALLIAWLIIWATMVFGVEASGKVAYVTALGPYLILITLLITGFTLDGMEVGLKYLFIPDFGKLLEANTWFQAVGQCFFSLGIGFGGCIMFSSYNEFHNDIIKDVLVISIMDTITSIIAGMSLLSILGFQATAKYKRLTTKDATQETKNEFFSLMSDCNIKVNNSAPWLDILKENKDHEDKVKTCTLEAIIGDEGGAGLAFVHYPAAMNQINQATKSKLGTTLGFFFFFMLILLAVGSANGFVGTTVTIISDKFPKWRRSNIVSGVCAFSCVLGLMYTNSVGAEWFDVVDIHGVTAVVYVLAFMEASTVVYIYGLRNFCNDLQYMRNGKRPGWYLKVTWAILPVLMIGIYFYWLITYKKIKTWTTAIVAIAWLMTTCCLLIIPITIGFKYYQFAMHPWRRNVSGYCAIFFAIFQPSPKWGPRDPQIRNGWRQFKATVPSSYNIPGFFKRLWNRIQRKPEPSVHPTTGVSYATFATGAPSSTQSGVEVPSEASAVNTESAANARKSNPK